MSGILYLRYLRLKEVKKWISWWSVAVEQYNISFDDAFFQFKSTKNQ